MRTAFILAMAAFCAADTPGWAKGLISLAAFAAILAVNSDDLGLRP